MSVRGFVPGPPETTGMVGRHRKLVNAANTFCAQLEKGEAVSKADTGVGGYAGMLRIEIELLFEQASQRHRFTGHDPFVMTV